MTEEHRSSTSRSARHPIRFAIAALGLALLGACGTGSRPGKDVPMAALDSVADSSWSRLAHRRVFFGHQSVGGNIMDGVSELVAEAPRLGLRVVAGERFPDSGGAFVHEKIGRNGDPGGKTDVFATLMENGLGDRADIALHKYCFVDVIDTTDVERLFDHYRTRMARLHAEYPGVTFVHVTAPVVVVRSDARAILKRLLGRPPAHVESNLARERYNELLRHEYAGREPIFDLAAVESTRPDGGREVVSFGQRSGFALYPGYATEDGSHLNASGRRRAAQALLVLLAALPGPAPAPAPSR